MTRMDKLTILGAWALMAAVGLFGVWKTSQAPRIDPRIAKLEYELKHPPGGYPPHDPVPRWNGLAFFGPVADARPASDAAGTLMPRFVASMRSHPIVQVQILPVAVMGEAKADLDGVKISWSLTDPEATLQYYERRSSAKPAGFIVERQYGNSPVEVLARLGADARSYADLSAEPKRTYRYWVTITGEETVRHSYPAAQERVTKRTAIASEVATPSATRVKLIGGDKANAILRIETYDRTQKKWIGRTVASAPGKEVGSSGWTLKGLRFDNFTLVADVSDDGGVDRVLTTKD